MTIIIIIIISITKKQDFIMYQRYQDIIMYQKLKQKNWQLVTQRQCTQLQKNLTVQWTQSSQNKPAQQ